MSQDQVETLRTYASILEKPSRMFDPVLRRHVMRGPGEILQAAIIALRFHAAAMSDADEVIGGINWSDGVARDEQSPAPEGK